MDPHDNRPLVCRDDLARLPYLTWNAFVDLLASAEYDGLTRLQRPAWLAFWYDAEVQNGGHRQFFKNRGTYRIEETIEALTRVGATGQGAVLQRAAQLYEAATRAPEGASEGAPELTDAFDALDRDYHRCSPEVHEILESYLEDHLEGFVRIA